MDSMTVFEILVRLQILVEDGIDFLKLWLKLKND